MGFCGEKGVVLGGCFCDNICVQEGDCCSDFKEVRQLT
ncbi:MAG: hypothetical protein IH964_10525 [Candidatus Dadabacteria bacterium]|nr:hypothetical protein [Candidatus Dadabacteria bacterium]